MPEMRAAHDPDWPLTTRWKILSLPKYPNKISVELSVDTVARPVIEAIEKAAAENGIVLERR